MKKDISKVIDLDSVLSSEEKPVVVENTQPEPIKVDWDSILTEWSYRCPKGYPTVVDGVFTEREEVIILNEILQEKFVDGIPLPEVATVDIGNETSAKEAIVMVFFDCIRANKAIVQLYARLQKEPNSKDIAELKKILSDSKEFGSDYGTGKASVKVDNLHKFVIETLSSDKRNTKQYKLVNNGFSAANTIATDSKIKPYIGSKSYATRGVTFEAIRKKAVSLFQQIGVSLQFEDNWCPGDFYLMDSSTAPTAENLPELNSNFAGPSYPKGSIVAISLKMEDAQAGKGTTFVSTVLSVPDIDQKKAKPSNTASKAGTKYLESKRLIAKYGTGKQTADEETLRKKLASPYKLIYDLTLDKKSIPTIVKYAQFGSTRDERAKQNKFLASKYLTMGKEAMAVIPSLDKKVLSSKNIKAYSEGFEQAYTEFKTFIRSIGIKNIQSAGAKEFVKMIMSGKGATKEGGPAKILIKKAECYTRAIELIQKWSDKNRAIAKPFKRLGAVDNPLLAITMFAIAQHGANPDFFKVHGSNTGLTGTLELFPAKSKVDNRSMVQSVAIVDSENAAGFNVEYQMKLNNVTYSTVLTFRFSQSQFRVEVQELEVEGEG